MTDALKNALKAGGVAGGGLLLVFGVASLILGPALIAAGWYFGWVSFEAAVITLLLLTIYLAGGGD